MYLFHGEGDELVPYENSQMAYDQFLANGAQDVHLESIPESYGGHSDVAHWALFGAYQVAKDIQMITELGDLNQDGDFNILDLVGIVNVILYGSEDSFTLWAGDVNMDDSVNIQDIILVINTILAT
jgi:hypothetical protein